MGRPKKRGVTLGKLESYKASLKCSGRTFKAEGDTIFQAISNLEPGKVHGRSVLTVSAGDKTKDRLLSPRFTMMTFNTMGTTRAVWVKNISNLFQGFDFKTL